MGSAPTDLIFWMIDLGLASQIDLLSIYRTWESQRPVARHAVDPSRSTVARVRPWCAQTPPCLLVCFIKLHTSEWRFSQLANDLFGYRHRRDTDGSASRRRQWGVGRKKPSVGAIAVEILVPVPDIQIVHYPFFTMVLRVLFLPRCLLASSINVQM